MVAAIPPSHTYGCTVLVPCMARACACALVRVWLTHHVELPGQVGGGQHEHQLRPTGQAVHLGEGGQGGRDGRASDLWTCRSTLVRGAVGVSGGRVRSGRARAFARSKVPPTRATGETASRSSQNATASMEVSVRQQI